MIIGIDASRANKKHKTGTEWYSYHLIKNLSKIDNKNRYILYVDQPLSNELMNLSENNSIAKTTVIKGLQKINCPHHNFMAKQLRWPFSFCWTQGRLSLEMIFSQIDLLFIPAHVLPLIHPKKSVVTIHDIGFIHLPALYDQDDLGPSGKKARGLFNSIFKFITYGKYKLNTIDYHKWSTEFALQHASKIITVSNFSKQDIIETYHQTEEKISVVYNGFDRLSYDYYKIDPEQAQVISKKYGISQNFFLYVGRLEKKKNISLLIEAFADFIETNKDFQLVLIGSPGYGFQEINYVINQHGLENKIIKTGWMAENELPYFFHKSSAFIYPSKYEGFGIPVLQAMACGAPVICSSSGSLKEIVNDAALLIDPDNKQSITNAMNQIIQDDKLRNDLISRGFANAKKFNWLNCAKETLEIIKSIM